MPFLLMIHSMYIQYLIISIQHTVIMCILFFHLDHESYILFNVQPQRPYELFITFTFLTDKCMYVCMLYHFLYFWLYNLLGRHFPEINICKCITVIKIMNWVLTCTFCIKNLNGLLRTYSDTQYIYIYKINKSVINCFMQQFLHEFQHLLFYPW